MEATSGFVDLYHRAFNLSPLFPAHCTKSPCIAIFSVGEAGEGITGRASGRVRAIRRDAREDILVCPSESHMRGALFGMHA
jgi:hypothetical protein